MGQSFKKIILIAALIIIIAGVFAIVYPHLSALHGDAVEKQIILHQTSNDTSAFYIEDKGVKLSVQIAETEGEREQGLSDVNNLSDDQGMLFIFDEPGYYQMWMKDMLFPLDILWLDQNFKVVDIKKELSPSTYPESFGPKSPAKYVLEINSGLSDKYGFAIGDQFSTTEGTPDL